MVYKLLTDRALDFNIILDDVSITDLSFSKEYAAAVEAKQVAQQEAQRAQFIVEKAKQERQQKVVQAEGEAASAKLISFHSCSNCFMTVSFIIIDIVMLCCYHLLFSFLKVHICVP